MSERNPDAKDAVVVLGAGPTGLGTALGVALNNTERPVWTIEKKSSPGGLAGSFHWNGHIIDYGPHRLSPNLESVRVLAEELLGPDCLINKSQHGVQFRGRLYQFPPRILDWIRPDSLWQLAAFAFSFLNAKLMWVIHRFDQETFESAVVSKFGKRFYRIIVAPMAEKVWTEPNQIDPAFVNQRFALIRPLEVLKKVIFPQQDLNPSLFYYPRKGFQQLWDNLSAYLQRDGQNILYEATPCNIEIRKNRIVRVEYKQGGATHCLEGDRLEVVSTIPIIKLLEIISGFDTQLLLEKARRTNFKSMFLVALEFDQPRTLPFRTLIYPEKNFYFNRLFEQNMYSPETIASGKSLVVADITYPRAEEPSRLGDTEIIEKVKNDLKKLSYIDCGRITAAHVERVEFAYSVPDRQSRRCFYEIRHELKKIQNLHLAGRFSTGEYDNSDYALENGLTLGTMLSGRTSRLEYLFVYHERRDRTIVG